MFSPWTIIAVIVAYVAGLFLIAQWAERAEIGKRASKLSGVYALGLAVYCTTWTYYGSVGKAATGGMGFLPVYLGPTLALLLGWTIFRRIVQIKHSHRITSIADFISGRYGKSQAVAAMVTFIMLIGIIPYVALQLKAVTDTFTQITAGSGSTSLSGWSSPIIATLMTVFTIAFGIRHLDATERHPGMVVVLATESIFKLLAFLAAGIFIVGSAFGGLGGFVEHFTASPPNLPLLKAGDTNQVLTWITVTLLSMSAFCFLPRQFHVGVVENDNPDHVRKSAWLTPLYLLVINIFVVPIAVGGSLLAAPGTTGDQYVLAIPIQSGQSLLSLGVFVGGFSAAIGMIMIETMTMATMISNHLVMPALEAFPPLSFLRRKMLYVRWVAAAVFIFAGYAFEVGLGGSHMLVAIGLISFAAAFIVAPVVLIGLYWREASRVGALLGLSGGFIVWGYTLFMPSLVRSGWLPKAILEQGPWGVAWLRPEALFGLAGLPSLTHGVIYSVFTTLTGLLVGSVLFPSGKEERALTDEFLDESGDFSYLDSKNRTIDANERREATLQVLRAYFAEEEAARICRQSFADVSITDQARLTVVEFAELHNTIERYLSGAIGSASAHGAMRSWGSIDRQDSRSLAREYGKMLAKLKLSPKEIKDRIDFQAERETLLNEQFKELQQKVDERDAEIVERRKAEVALQEAHDELESRVEQRTSELNQRNHDMRLVFDTVDQGFITIDVHGGIGSERSRVIEEWFGIKPGHTDRTLQTVLRTFDDHVGDLLELGLEQIRDAYLPLSLCLSQLPKAFEFEQKHYELTYHPVTRSDGKLQHILVVATDVTARVESARGEERQKEVVSLFEHFMRDRPGVLRFFADGDRLVENIAAWSDDSDPVVVKRDIHTLKGNAAIMGVTSVARRAHELEEAAAERSGIPSAAVLHLKNEWQGLRARIDEIIQTDNAGIHLEEADYLEILHALERNVPRDELREMIARWRLEPTRRSLGRLAAQATRLADRMGKGDVNVHIEDNNVRLHDEEWGDFWSILVHAVRNIVDHGLEDPEERVRVAKPEAGTIRLRTEETEDALRIELSDDGRGIAWDKLKARAEEHGLPHQTIEDLREIIFHDGISTRDAVTTISGRGVGMSAIRAETQRRGGKVSVFSETGVGTTLAFEFPKASARGSETAA